MTDTKPEKAAETAPTAETAQKAGTNENKISKKMNIGEIAMKHPETVDIFMKYGMHCLGCVAARFETLEEGCVAHGIDTDAMVKDLNAALNSKKEKK